MYIGVAWTCRKNGRPKTATNLLEGKPEGGTEKGRPRFPIGLGE